MPDVKIFVIIGAKLSGMHRQAIKSDKRVRSDRADCDHDAVVSGATSVPANHARHGHNGTTATTVIRTALRCGPLALVCRLFAAVSLVLLLSACDSERYLSFLNPQGPIAAAQRTHFLWVVGILVVFVALPIFLFLPWVLWRYRYRATASRYSPGWKANLPLELMTWAGPILIVVVLGVMLWHYAHELDPYQPVAPKAQALQVQAIGYNWKWLFVYPDKGIASVGVLAIPTNKPVAMHLTSATVMQSLHIPALVSQIYAMGGMVTQLHFMATQPGKSLGMNNMYNGKGFHQQRFTAIAMPPDKFAAWVKKVRKLGQPLNADSYAMLSKHNTVTELTAALPQASKSGNVYLTQVSANLFPAVVEATMTDTRKALDHVLTTPPGTSPVTPNDVGSLLEMAP